MPAGPFTWFDGVALGLLLLFAWHGYRRGLLGWLAGIGASLLSLILSFLLTPLVSMLFAHQTGWGSLISERVAFVLLLVLLRILLGFAFRELVAALRPLLYMLPPLALADHLLGVVPGIAMGGLLVLSLLAFALFVPPDRQIHDAAAGSYVDRLTVEAAWAAGQRLTASGIPAQPAEILAAGRQLLTGRPESPIGSR